MSKVIKEDKFGWPKESLLTEEVNEFGIPGEGKISEETSIAEAARINYKGLLGDLIAAVDMHMAIMAGTAEAEAVDSLETVLAATKEALEPKEEPGEGNEEPTEENMDEMARKVTDEVAAAFLAGKPKKVANTHTDGKSFFFHGNEIAKIEDGQLSITNAGWATRTTHERLNGILQMAGLDAHTSLKGKESMLNDEPWDGSWTKVGKVKKAA
jgi:hypothetical protein